MNLRQKDSVWRKPRGESYALFPTVEAALIRILPGGMPDRGGLRSAWKLIAFLLRKHTGPKVIGRSFPLDRRAMAQIADLGLTEHPIRIAVGHLERLGLVVRVASEGTGYQHRPGQGARRKAITYRLAPFLVRLIRTVQQANPFKSHKHSPAKQDALLGRTAPAAPVWTPPRAAMAPTEPNPGLEGTLARVAGLIAARRGAQNG